MISIHYKTIVPVLLAMCALTHLAVPVLAENPEADGAKVAENFWDRIRSVPNPPDSEGWQATSDEVQSLFHEMVQGGELKEKARYYVDQFGRAGPEADLKWALAESAILLPQNSGHEMHRVDMSVEEYTALQAAFWEALARRLLSDQEMRSRYWHLAVWSRLYLPPGRRASNRIMWDVEKASERLAVATGEEYWWHARNFILAAHATGRDDVLQGADPLRLEKNVAQWYTWVKSNDLYFVALRNHPGWVLDESATRRPTVDDVGRWPEIFEPELPLPDWSSKVEQPPKNCFNLAFIGSLKDK